jgi:hypothetical protein
VLHSTQLASDAAAFAPVVFHYRNGSTEENKINESFAKAFWDADWTFRHVGDNKIHVYEPGTEFSNALNAVNGRVNIVHPYLDGSGSFNIFLSLHKVLGHASDYDDRKDDVVEAMRQTAENAQFATVLVGGNDLATMDGVGVRKAQKPSDGDRSWREMWNVLYGVHKSVHPLVYAVTRANGRPIYVMEKGLSLLKAIYFVEDFDFFNNELKFQLVDLMRACANAGILMLDIKPDNIVIMANNNSLSVKVIDLDGKFTHVFMDSQRYNNNYCIKIINSVLLIRHMKCKMVSKNNPIVSRRTIALLKPLIYSLKAHWIRRLHDSLCDVVYEALLKDPSVKYVSDRLPTRIVKILRRQLQYYTRFENLDNDCQTLYDKDFDPNAAYWPQLVGYATMYPDIDAEGNVKDVDVDVDEK